MLTQVTDVHRRELLDQALLFPAIHRAYERYRRQSPHPQRLARLQRARLHRLLSRAVTAVPAYRGAPVRTRDLADPLVALAAFPLVDKASIRSRFADHCDDDIAPARCRTTATSGTTGSPFRFIVNIDHLVHGYALALLRNDRHRLPLHRKVLHALRARVTGWLEYTAPAHGLARVAELGEDNDPDWTGYLVLAAAFRPDVLVGHPSRCLRLRDLLIAGGIEVPAPALVLTWGEQLTPGMRTALSQFYAAPVFDMYGMREFGTIAAECDHGRYHIEAERLWVEVVDAGGRPVPDGQAGEIVVTNLLNAAMPFIRYRTGDIGALATAPCPCGQPQKTLRLVEGREAGYIQLPDGRRVNARRAIRIVLDYPVEQVQVSQISTTEVTITVRPLPSFDAGTAAALQQRVHTLLDNLVRVNVDPVMNIPAIDRGGRKATVFRSLLAASGEPAHHHTGDAG